MPVTSTGGTPSTIQCARTIPVPAPLRMPSEFMPQATQRFRSSGVGPTSGARSGVKLSGPQNSFLTP